MFSLGFKLRCWTVLAWAGLASFPVLASPQGHDSSPALTSAEPKGGTMSDREQAGLQQPESDQNQCDKRKRKAVHRGDTPA